MNISGIEFEHVCQALVEKMGFTTQTTKASGDGGIDLIAYNHQPLFSGKYIIQCKRYAGSVGEPIIRDLYGVITSERANKGILMTTGHFTKSAIAFSEGKPIELIDGEKLKSLLTDYGINNKVVCEDDISIKEVFESNIMIEDMYDYYIDNIETLSVTNDEKARAEFINQLLYWTMSECPDIEDFNHRLAIFKEIKNQITQYLKKPRIARSKYLAYLYQMAYVQISILQGNFNDAVSMFQILMDNQDLQFDELETVEPTHTKPLYGEHQTIFWSMYYTYYDMRQIALILNDESLSWDLKYESNFDGYRFLSLMTIEKAIKRFQQSGEKTGERYWIGELEAYHNMDTLYGLYFMSDYEPKMYYSYTYQGGSVSNALLDCHNIAVKNNSLIVDNIGTIENLQGCVDNYSRQ